MSLRVAVVGLGSIGRRHLGILQELGCETAAVRRRPSDGELGSLDEAGDWGAQAIVVATPTSDHAAALRWAVKRGVHAYLEKPIADHAAGLDDLLRRAERKGVVVATGYNLRFHPALEAIRAAVRAGRIGRLLSVRAEVGQYLPDWHPGEDHRRWYVARADLGGGALLTLSHELDYVCWVAGAAIACDGRAMRVADLTVDADDVVELVCRHEGGAASGVHLDLLDRAYHRRSRWVGELGTLAWEWGDSVRLLPDGTVLWDDPLFDLTDTYRSALADFLEACAERRKPRCDGFEGLRTLELLEQVARER